jgi:hypothetical protein
MYVESPIAIFALCLMGVLSLATFLAIIDSVMKPIRIQRQREVHCQHAFERHTHELRPGVAFETRFCPKCACTRIISSGNDFVLLSKPVKKPANRAGRKSSPRRQRQGAAK